MRKANFWQMPEDWDRKEEYCEIIWQNDHLRLERIISCGHVSPIGFWYEQTEDEWVFVLQGEGEIEWADGTKTLLKSGEYILIPAQKRHRVSYTTKTPECIWLALFAEAAGKEEQNDEKNPAKYI